MHLVSLKQSKSESAPAFSLYLYLYLWGHNTKYNTRIIHKTYTLCHYRRGKVNCPCIVIFICGLQCWCTLCFSCFRIWITHALYLHLYLWVDAPCASFEKLYQHLPSLPATSLSSTFPALKCESSMPFLCIFICDCVYICICGLMHFVQVQKNCISACLLCLPLHFLLIFLL